MLILVTEIPEEANLARAKAAVHHVVTRLEVSCNADYKDCSYCYSLLYSETLFAHMYKEKYKYCTDFFSSSNNTDRFTFVISISVRYTRQVLWDMEQQCQATMTLTWSSTPEVK